MEIQKELVPIEKTVTLVSKKVADLVIKDAITMATATELLSQVNRYADSIDEKKQEVLAPMNEALKKFRAMFKPLETKCDEAIKTIRGKMTVYQTKKIEEERKKETKLVEKMESGEIDIDQAVNKLNKITRVEKTVETESGSIRFREDKILKIWDHTMIEREYLIPNERQILQALKDGKKVSGCELETIQTPINYR
jgi:exonuclease VII small subunit